MKWKQTAAATKNANGAYDLLKKSFTLLDNITRPPLYKSLVCPHQEFGNVVWGPHYAEDIKYIDKVQRLATKLSCEERLHERFHQAYAFSIHVFTRYTFFHIHVFTSIHVFTGYTHIHQYTRFLYLFSLGIHFHIHVFTSIHVFTRYTRIHQYTRFHQVYTYSLVYTFSLGIHVFTRYTRFLYLFSLGIHFHIHVFTSIHVFTRYTRFHQYTRCHQVYTYSLVYTPFTRYTRIHWYTRFHQVYTYSLGIHLFTRYICFLYLFSLGIHFHMRVSLVYTFSLAGVTPTAPVLHQQYNFGWVGHECGRCNGQRSAGPAFSFSSHQIQSWYRFSLKT